MADPRKSRQQAISNRKLKATQDARTVVKDKLRKNIRPETTVATHGQLRSEKAPKRKRGDDPDLKPRKKLRTEDQRSNAKTVRTYREPKGVRKSRRIAGKTAEEPGLAIGGQQNEQVIDTSVAHGAGHIGSHPEIFGEQSNQPDVSDHPPVAQQSDAGSPNKVNTAESSERAQEFLKVIANNVGSHRVVRWMTSNYNEWFQWTVDLVHGKDGLNEVEEQLKSMETDEAHDLEDLEFLRARRAKRLDQLKEGRTLVNVRAKAMDDLGATHACRNERIYEFNDVPRDSQELLLLPQEFWTAYDQCALAHSACKDMEQEINQLETEQREVLVRLDKQTDVPVGHDDQDAARSSGEAAQDAQLGKPLAGLWEHIKALSKIYDTLGGLKTKLNDAKDTRYDQESKLNIVAENALVAAGMTTIMTGVEEVTFHRRFAVVHEPDMQNEVRDQGYERRNQVLPSGDAIKAAATADLKQAREKLETCRRRLADIRSGPISDVSSLDSDLRGQARFEKLIERTRDVRDAENQYKSMLHQEPDFQDHESDGYPASEFSRFMKHPRTKAHMNRIQEWAEDIGRSRKDHQTAQYLQANDKEGTWVNRVPSMPFGASPETGEISRDRHLIEQQKELREHLRATGPFENAENDFHPKNNPARSSGEEIDQSDRETPAQFDAEENVMPRGRKRSRTPSDEFSSVDGDGSTSTVRERKKVRAARSL